MYAKRNEKSVAGGDNRAVEFSPILITNGKSTRVDLRECVRVCLSSKLKKRQQHVYFRQ